MIDPDPVSASGLVFMGGPMSVNDELEWIAQEVALIQSAHKKQIPVLGHCLGGQLISKALGAVVSSNPVSEIGWHEVNTRENPTAHEWFGGLAENFEVFHWHGETFSLPENAIPLLQSRFCQNQAYLCGKTLAMQCHIEMQTEMIPEWSDQYAEQIQETSDSVQSAAEMSDNLEKRIQQLHRVADIIYSRWLKFFE